MLKKILSFILYQWGRVANARKLNVLSLYFHNPTPKAFEDIVLWLVRHDYSFISSDELIKHMTGQNVLTGKSVYISLDDGWQGNLELLPIIEKYAIPITIFIATEPLESGNYWWEYVFQAGGQTKINEFKEYESERFINELKPLKSKYTLSRSSMTIDELVDLSYHPLIEIQSHTHTHPILTKVNAASLDLELTYSKEYLIGIIGKDANKFSYPNGSYSTREKNLAKLHYTCAFSTIQSYPEVGGDIYEIPRIALTNDYWSNLAKIVGAWGIIWALK